MSDGHSGSILHAMALVADVGRGGGGKEGSGEKEGAQTSERRVVSERVW